MTKSQTSPHFITWLKVERRTFDLMMVYIDTITLLTAGGIGHVEEIKTRGRMWKDGESVKHCN